MGQSMPLNRPAVVLMVEDEPLISEMVAEVLTDEGFFVRVVSTARDAIAYLASGAEVDILFTDINLPGDMDGSALAEHVRAARPDLPIVYASGRWAPSAEQRLVSRALFLQKPYNPQEAGTLFTRMIGA
jgi:CheY-like chemotaxis protein